VSDVNSCVSVRFLKPSDIPLLVAAFDAQGWRKPTSLFDAYVQESTQGARTALAKRIPEISDLNVLKVYHRKGIASALMEAAETLVFQTYQCVGLGVGLLSDYGPAQRLYIKRGYKPDGMGLTYQETLCRHGDRVTADDDLLLWCVKEKI